MHGGKFWIPVASPGRLNRWTQVSQTLIMQVCSPFRVQRKYLDLLCCPLSWRSSSCQWLPSSHLKPSDDLGRLFPYRSVSFLCHRSCKIFFHANGLLAPCPTRLLQDQWINLPTVQPGWPYGGSLLLPVSQYGSLSRWTSAKWRPQCWVVFSAQRLNIVFSAELWVFVNNLIWGHYFFIFFSCYKCKAACFDTNWCLWRASFCVFSPILSHISDTQQAVEGPAGQSSLLPHWCDAISNLIAYRLKHAHN